MKNKTFRQIGCAFSLSLFTSFCWAQPPVTAGLKLYLDNAATNFTPVSGLTPASWTDNSGAGNNMVGFSSAASPTLAGGIFPGVAFNGIDQIMKNIALDSSMNNTEATLFVVRIANTDSNTIIDHFEPTYKATLAIGEDESWHNEFSLISNAISHHSSSGNWTERKHQCYSSLPDDRPVILTGAFGATPMSIDYRVNGIVSASSIASYGTPWDFPAVNRRIYLGGRRPYGNSRFLFKGIILEVLVYNRLLTNAEIVQVNTYLKCKYDIDYTTCNVPEDCTTGLGPDDAQEGGKTGVLLEQNVPNPATGETVIGYQLGRKQTGAYIALYDLSGKELSRYPVLSQGKGSIVVPTDRMAPGMYLYSLVIGGERGATKKLVICK